MATRQIIGMGILAGVVAAFVGLTMAVEREAPKAANNPQPRIMIQQPQGPAQEWRTFVCQQNGRTLHSFTEAKAEPGDRRNGQQQWKVTKKNGDSTVLTVNPTNVICGYVKS